MLPGKLVHSKIPLAISQKKCSVTIHETVQLPWPYRSWMRFNKFTAVMLKLKNNFRWQFYIHVIEQWELFLKMAAILTEGTFNKCLLYAVFEQKCCGKTLVLAVIWKFCNSTVSTYRWILTDLRKNICEALGGITFSPAGMLKISGTEPGLC